VGKGSRGLLDLGTAALVVYVPSIEELFLKFREGGRPLFFWTYRPLVLFGMESLVSAAASSEDSSSFYSVNDS
jgi:hypothetical protein